MTPKQKTHRERFKKVMAEAKKMRSKNKNLTQAEAVKKAWSIISGSTTKTRPKKRTSTTAVKNALTLAKKTAAKKTAAKKQSRKRVGATALTKKGVPAKRLNKGQRDYNKTVDEYNYYLIVDGRVVEGYEYKEDANDAASEYTPKAKVVAKRTLKSLKIENPNSKWKYSLGRTHKDTKSHNVNIRVVSGFQEFNATQVKELQHLTNSLASAQYNLKRTIEQKKATRDKDNKMYLTRAADRYRDEIAGLKKQITIVKRLIK